MIINTIASVVKKSLSIIQAKKLEIIKIVDLAYDLESSLNSLEKVLQFELSDQPLDNFEVMQSYLRLNTKTNEPSIPPIILNKYFYTDSEP